METIVDRIKEVLVKPIVYGNTAEMMPRKTVDGHTHRWKMFVRPYYDEDMSKYVRKVQFKLHESYVNPLRTIEQPPFELVETGYGEFEATIKLFFVDINEKPVTAPYYLHLYSPVYKIDGRQTVLYEHYDEIVFTEPTLSMSQALREQVVTQPISSPTDFAAIKQNTLDKLNAALKDVTAEIHELRESLKQTVEQFERASRQPNDDASRATSVSAEGGASNDGADVSQAPASAGGPTEGNGVEPMDTDEQKPGVSGTA